MPPLVTHVVGARPNFMKAAPVIDGLDDLGVRRHVLHTGQHYDTQLSQVFFDQLGLPAPDVNLGVGSGTHGEQTGALITALEKTLVELSPAAVVVYGDVNSTLAAAVVTSKLLIPLVHVEAGLRSFDWTMPEEINRRVTDTLADLLLVTSPEALAHLADEGVPAERMAFVGNPMIDTLLSHLDAFDPERVKQQLGLTDRYVATTLHRPANVDDPDRARAIVDALRKIGELAEVVIPLHPRGRERLANAGLTDADRVRVLEPLGYVEFLSLVRGAALVVTDSGGVQEETTILDIPCLTVRPNTERPITISAGTNRLVEPEELPEAAAAILNGTITMPDVRPPLWDGHAGPRAAAVIRDFLDGHGPPPRAAIA